MTTKRQFKRNYWKQEEELLLKEWADKSQCYQWMHLKSREIYQKKNAWYTIPVIIISTITGTANFAQERFSESQRPYANMTIGTLSIVAGIITTVAQFLKVSELNEGHRVAALSWGKFYRELNTQLIKHPLDRKAPDAFMEYCKEEYNRLVEISPPMPKSIINAFKNQFKKTDELTKPEIGDFLQATKIYEMSEKARDEMINELNKDIVKSNKKIEQKAMLKQKKINNFRQSFYTLNGRDPSDEDIKNNIEFFNDEDENDNANNNDDANNTDVNIEINSLNDTTEENSHNTSPKSTVSEV